MPFYQNVFDTEFRGVLGQVTQTFIIKANINSSQLMSSFNAGPYNVSSDKTLTLNYSFDFGTSWTALAIDVSTTAATTSAALASEIVGALNANTTFAALFNASTNTDLKSGLSYVVIRSLRQRTNFRVYISNTGAEKQLKFNKNAPVGEIPSFFSRHTIANKNSYSDSLGVLVELNTADATDQAIITAAGFDYTSPKADWELLGGRSKLFNFQKITVDGSDRITQIIEYPAGAVAGDLGRKINYVYTSTNTKPDQITEIPYIIQSGDLVTPS